MGFSQSSSVSRPSAATWLSLVTVFCIQFISGDNYTFSSYSDALKSLMHLTQVELNSLSAARDVGKVFGFLAGLASDRFPTWAILLIGSLEALLGYGVQWLVVSQRIQPLPYWQMCIFLGLGGNSTTWMNTAVLVTCIRNFRRNRGPVSGILKGLLASPVHSSLKALPVLDIEEGGKEPSLQSEVKVREETAATEVVVGKRRPVVGEEHTIVEALSTIDFWILFVSFLCGVGTSLAVMNNMGQIGLALGHSDVSLFVVLTSICGFFGRIISGPLSEYFIKKAATPRPLWNAASQIVMGVGYILMAMALPGSLYIASVVVGICYGVRLTITVPTASELFGLKSYGLIYHILILNLPLGSFLFSRLLAGICYDMEATAIAGGVNTCVGAHCYRLVFIIMAAACIVGFLLDILLSVRTKNVYKKISASKNIR